MPYKHPLFAALTTIGLLALSGSGCSSDKDSDAARASLCSQLDAKQNELDCKVAALEIVCASGDATCVTNKQASLAKCNSLTTANWTSTRTSVCAMIASAQATATATSSSTTTTTDTTVTTSSAVTTVIQ